MVSYSQVLHCQVNKHSVDCNFVALYSQHVYCYHCQIPGRWEMMVGRLRQSAEEDCVLFYDAEMSAIHRLHQHGGCVLLL